MGDSCGAKNSSYFGHLFTIILGGVRLGGMEKGRKKSKQIYYDFFFLLMLFGIFKFFD